MRRGGRVDDALRRGMGRAGAAIGVWCNAFRPDGPGTPLAPVNRYLRLQAGFGPPSERWRTPGYGGALWWGWFDAAYTRVGDYILRAESQTGKGDGGIWFIAAQEPLLPVLCVRTSRMLDVARPAGASQQGVNTYGGVAKSDAVRLLGQWPAAVLAGGVGGVGSADLPSDVPAGAWQVLLPLLPQVVLRGGDILSDDLGRTAIVSSAELTQLGWRLVARQATT